MGRPLRATQGGLVYQTQNLANARLAIFADEGDFAAFERALSRGSDPINGFQGLRVHSSFNTKPLSGADPFHEPYPGDQGLLFEPVNQERPKTED